VTGAPTTTSIPLLVTLPTSPSLAGTYAYSEELGESRLISANTSSTLTTAAFTTAPTVGTRIHLGRVNAEAKTKAFRAKNGMDVAGRSLRIHYEPLAVVAGAERRLRVRFYRDWSSTQVPQSAGPYAKPPNCTLDAATGDWLVDLTEPTGRATVPIGSGSASVVEIEIEITDSSVPVKILGLSVEGVDLEPVGTGHQ
jgi:hypothetical protein